MNQDFVKNSESVVKMILITCIVLGGFLDLLVWRNRKFAVGIFYYELIVFIIHGFVPYDFGETGDLLALFSLYMVFLGYACDLGRNVISTVCTLLITTIAIMPLVNSEESNSFGKIFRRLYDGGMVFMICTVCTIIISYIKLIRGQMRQLMAENLNLLNKINEGLIVLSEKD